jgi:putative PIN family toxin of toxin-antitoxin system
MNSAAVFDCMNFLQAAARPSSPARACLKLVEEGAIRLFVSIVVLDEVKDVLTRPTIVKKFPALKSEHVQAFLALVEQVATKLEEVPCVFSFPRDPKDEPYLNLAIAAKVTYLVSRDNDLLDLMRADTRDGKDFQSRFPDLRIIDPVAFLQMWRAEETR